jgi:hypothetical protein
MSKKIKLKPKLNKSANSDWEIVDTPIMQDGGNFKFQNNLQYKENPYAFGGNVMLERYKEGGGVTDKKSTLSKLKKALSLRENLGNLDTEKGYNTPLNQILRTAVGIEGKDYSNESMSSLAREQDAFRMYLGLPSKTGAFEQTGSNKYRIRDYGQLYPETMPSDEAVLYSNKINTAVEMDKSPVDLNKIVDLTPYADILMGTHNVVKGKDDKGEYLKYYDRFDFDPTKHANQFIDKNFNPSVAKYLKKATPVLDKLESAIFNPFELEDKVYYDPKTKLRSDIILQQNRQRVVPGQPIAISADFKSGGEIIKRADGSYSRKGLWDNIRENAGSGKKPTKEMLKQEKKIKAAENKAANGKEIKKSTKNSYRDPLLGVNIPTAPINPMSQRVDYLYNTLNPNEEDPFEAINYIRYKTGIKRSIPKKDDANQNEAFWKKYLGMPNDVKLSKYKDPKYPNVKEFSKVNELLEDAIFDKYKNINVPDSIVNEGSLPIKEWYTPLGNFTVGKDKDKNGEFVYYRDVYDFPSKIKEEFKVGKDYNIYGKRYLDEFEDGGMTSDWEIIEDFDEMPEYKHGGKTPAWQRKEGKSPTGGLNAKGRASLKAEGHDIKPPQPQGGARKKSFCARMKGHKKKNTSAKTANDPNSRINLSLKKWKC